MGGRLAGKCALITGAASGIGRSTVALFHAEGARVAATDRNEGGLGALNSEADLTLAQDVTYQNLKGDTLRFPLGALFLHVVNHSTYHRGQVTTLLRQLGAQPVSTDLAVFLASR